MKVENNFPLSQDPNNVDSGFILWNWFVKLYSIFLLFLVIWRESRGESEECWKAVGCSVRNRVNNPKWWGTNFVEVITKKWQYSSIAAPNDPQLILFPSLKNGDKGIAIRIFKIAWDIVDGKINSPVPGADSYYDISLDKIGKPPKWAESSKFVKQVDAIKFYNLDNDYEFISTVDNPAEVKN